MRLSVEKERCFSASLSSTDTFTIREVHILTINVDYAQKTLHHELDMSARRGYVNARD